MVFDLLGTGGEDLSRRPLQARRKVLETTVPSDDRLLVSVQTDDPVVARAWLEGSSPAALEGVVAKRADEPYRPGKRSWVKVKRFVTMDLVVGGYVGEPGHPRSLLLGGYDESGRLRYMGGTLHRSQEWSGDPTLRAVLEVAAPSSFVDEPGRSRWESHRFEEWFALPPILVCEVALSRLDGGFLRHGARLMRWRPDKDPTDCALPSM
ncbi:MAG: hypothetical protein M3124_01885 [Actinomycetota bacterium]|nr:hypothetical protein [Actinomycetota bacterium]